MATKGRFITKIKTDSDTLKTSEISIEIPVTPPSINRLERRNPFKPNAAEKIPVMIRPKLNKPRTKRFIEPSIAQLRARCSTNEHDRLNHFFSECVFSAEISML